MEETGLAFKPFIHPALLFGAAAVVVALSWAGYRRTSRPLSRRYKRVLLALRFGAVAALLLCLLRPSLETVHHEVSKRPLLLLMDKSASMTDISDTPSGLSRSAAVEAVLEEHRRDLDELQ